jgi:hypothetical protein
VGVATDFGIVGSIGRARSFRVDVEWQNALVFTSDDENYIVLSRDGVVETKGAKWRGRDKEDYRTVALLTFLRTWATKGPDAAMAYAHRVLEDIESGRIAPGRMISF